MRAAFLMVSATLSAGCSNSATNAVEATVSPDMETVVTLRWGPETCPGATAQVTLDPDTGEAVGSDQDGETQLLGLLPFTDYHFDIDLVVDGQTCRHHEGEFTTGATAMGAVGTSTEGDDIGGYVMTSLLTGPSGPMLLSGGGDVVWGLPDPGDVEDGAGPVVSRARLAHDRRSVLYGAYLLYPEDAEPINDIVRVSIDGSEVVRTPTQRMHHDFLEHSDGTIAYLGSEATEVYGDDEPWLGDIIVELSPDGDERVVWSVWDEFPWGTIDWPITAEGIDHQEWSHANVLQFDEDEGAYYVSLRGQSAILKIDARTGERLWTMGGRRSDFELTQGLWFFEQHGFRVEDGELVVFDNGDFNSLRSRVVRYRFDESSMSVEQTWDHESVPATYVYVLGDVQPLANGDTMVAWATSGQLDALAPDGKRVWRMNFEVGHVIGYLQRLPDLGALDE